MYSAESESWMVAASEARDCCTWDEFRDRSRRPVPYGLYYLWQMRDGDLTTGSANAIVLYRDAFDFVAKYMARVNINLLSRLWHEIVLLQEDYPNQLRRELEARNARLEAEALDTAKRAAEKQASRDKDQADIDSGLKTAEQVNQDNGPFVKLGLKMNMESARAKY